MNSNQDEVAKLFQIWIQTKEDNIEPSYSQKEFSPGERKDQLQLLVSPEGKGNVLQIHQDAYISRGDISE